MISIIIPVLNEAGTIGGCLSRLAGERVPHETLVVDGGSTDGTLDVVNSFPGVTQLCSPKGRGVQMNTGAGAARGETLLFLHADTLLPRGGLAHIEQLMERDDVVAGSFYLRFGHPGLLLDVYSRFSRINHVLFPYGDQGLFMPEKILLH